MEVGACSRWALILGGRLFEVERSLTFLVIRVGAYSRLALIRGWRLFEVGRSLIFLAVRVGAYSRLALINSFGHQGGRLFKVSAY